MGFWRRRFTRRNERGAVVAYAVIFLGVMMTSSAFVVDLGMQRVARSDAQAVADMLALDLAREIDGRTVAQLAPVLATVSAESLARNADIVGSEVPVVDYALGSMGSGGFTPMTSGVPTAVEVEVRAGVDFAFAGVTGRDRGNAVRSAQAASSSTACFRLGTFVAAVRSGDSTVLAPLNEMLGVNLDLVSYRGLADANLRLGQLAAEPTIGSPEALLSGSIRYSDLLSAMASALAKETPGVSTVALTALGKLVASQVTAGLGQISLANVLHVAPTDSAAMDVELSVLDIIGSARLSDGQYFLGVPNIQGGVPGVGWQFTGAIYLVSAAELACGAPNSPGATADTAQLDGTLGINFTNLPSISVPGLGTLQTPKGGGFLELEAGSGTGVLSSDVPVHCSTGPGDPTTYRVDVGTSLASYKLNANVSVAADVRVTDLLGFNLLGLLTDLLGLGLPSKLSLEVDVTLTIGTTKDASTSPVDVALPPNDVTPKSTGGSMLLDPASIVPTVTSVKIGGRSVELPLVKAITDLITHELVTAGQGFVGKTLTPLVNNINQQFIGPVARMVGLRLGGADVYAVGATCGRPRLVG